MTTVYKFEFDKDEKKIEVHFVDRSASIDDAEALAQISSLHRRQWAAHSIDLMKSADKLFWSNFPIRTDMDCPFGRRLFEEKWNNSTAFVYLSDTMTCLFIYRLYIFIFIFTQ